MAEVIQPINVFVPTYRVEETLAQIRECLERGWTGLGYKTDEFEKAWCSYTGLPHAHFVNSATGALQLAVELLGAKHGWSHGDEVITTPLTFVSTNHAIMYAGLQPRFADVDDSLNLDPASVERCITPRTRAVMFVGMGGSWTNLPAISRLCRDRGLQLILDGAHMAGSRIYHRHVGFDADAAVFSFHAVKNLPTADSGMLCMADYGLDIEARKMSWLGINKTTYQRTGQTGTYRWEYDVEAVGYKLHGNSVMAAMGLVALKYLDQDNAYRRQIAEWYDERLAGLGNLAPVDGTPGQFVRMGKVASVPHSPGSARHLYQILVEDRDALMVALNAESIFPGVHYKDNRAHTCYSTHPAGGVAFEKSQHLVTLPMHLRMTFADVQRVADAIERFCRRRP